MYLLKSPIRHFQTVSPFTGNGPVWSRHDSGSRACSGGVGSCSYWRRRWIWRTQTPFPRALLILFDRDQRRDRDYVTHGNSPNPLSCPGSNRFTNPVLVWSELIWLGSGRVHNYTVLLALIQSPQIIPCKNWNWKLEPVNWSSESPFTANQWLTFKPCPFLHGMVSCDCTGASKIVLFLFTTGVSMKFILWTTSKPTSARFRTKIVTRPNLSVPSDGAIVWKCRIGLFETRAICSCMWEAVLKLTMDHKMTKHMVNNCTLKESRTWLLVCTRHCYFIPFNHEHPVNGGWCDGSWISYVWHYGWAVSMSNVTGHWYCV